MPRDDNISVKEYNKISKYKDLEMEIEKMWHLKTTTVLGIVWALDIIKKRTDKHINKIINSPSLYEIQKIALNRIVHLLRTVLSMWQKNHSEVAAKDINT